jgi:hypothetical protein
VRRDGGGTGGTRRWRFLGGSAFALTLVLWVGAVYLQSTNAAMGSGSLTFGLTRDLRAAGGEPSIQDDRRGHIYVTTPRGIGSVDGGVLRSRSLKGITETWVRGRSHTMQEDR